MEHDAPQGPPDTARPTFDEITERTDALLDCITDRSGLLRPASDAAGGMLYAASEALYGGAAPADVIAFTDELRTAVDRLRAEAVAETRRRHDATEAVRARLFTRLATVVRHPRARRETP